MQNTAAARAPKRAIESDDFPIGFISTLATRESWRKEVYRPMCHMHKWWARRLGTVFHGILLGCLISPDDDFGGAFYGRTEYRGTSVLDPFMGSGTTVMEAYRLGCTALGMDINPVACESVRVAMSPMKREDLQRSFEQVSEKTGKKIRNLYRIGDGTVLYFFWVKQVACPSCKFMTDLFSTYVFARNMHPDKHNVRIICPGCGDVFLGMAQDRKARCTECSYAFDPRAGLVSGTKARCQHCSHEFPIVGAVRDTREKPAHRLYAKLVLNPDGTKRYLKATDSDAEEYAKCTQILEMMVRNKTIRLPVTGLDEGHNTCQAINYNYNEWRDFFNDRQLLALGWLHDAILQIGDRTSRDALLLLFSGILEFNNMFATYKGEGTGAVRHMFSHHILKPERMPIEANVWGTEKSSGSFLTLFKSRLLRAVDYRNAPFELSYNGRAKTVPFGRPFDGGAATSLPARIGSDSSGAYIACGSSDRTGLPGKSIDYVITDPPFFDNVYYSELADFFYSWQSLHPRGFIGRGRTTRNSSEVQDSSPEGFSRKLTSVFAECNRVLKDDGLMVFTYHHSRPDGWRSVARAVHDAEFAMVNAHPVKSEMSVGVPKSQAKSPIQLDVVFVCRKDDGRRRGAAPYTAASAAVGKARHKAGLLEAAGLDLSVNDLRVIAYSQFLVALGSRGPDTTQDVFNGCLSGLDSAMARADYP